MKKLLIILITTIALKAGVITLENINPNKSAIQIATLKSKKNITYLVKRYKPYDIYIKEQNEWHVVYVVNIPVQNKFDSLKYLKGIDKGAFFINPKKLVFNETLRKKEARKQKVPLNSIKLNAPKEIKNNSQQRSIYIKDIVLENDSVIKSNDLKGIIKKYTNKYLTMSELNDIALQITNYFQEQGYPLTKAFIPMQNMKNSILQIVIAEGKFGKFIINNNSTVKSGVIEKFLNKSGEEKVISESALKNRLNRLNVLSGIQVLNTQISSTKKPQVVDFVVSTQDDTKFSSYITTDNYGSKYTGEYNLGVGSTVNNLSGIGDTLSLNGSVTDSSKSKSISGSYLRHIGYDGITGGFNFSYSKYELENIPNYETLGDSSGFGLSLNYPLESNSIYNRSLAFAYNFKKVKSDSGVLGLTQLSDKELNTLQVSYIDQRLLNTTFPSSLISDLSFMIGDVKMASETAKTNDVYLNSEGTFSKMSANFNYGVQFSKDITLQSKLQAQKSMIRNLDSSEDFSASGSSAVRAYENSELSGDDGVLASIELFYNLPKVSNFSHNTSIFIDHAKVWKNLQKFNSEDNSRTLNSVGVGYGLSYKNFSLKSSIAYGFGKDSLPESEAEFSTSKVKFLIKGIYQF